MSKLPVSCTLAAALVAMSFVLGPQSLRAAPLCPFGNATLHGTYSLSGGGTVVGLGPVTSVGEVTYDGKGNSNAVYTASLNGTIHPGSFQYNSSRDLRFVSPATDRGQLRASHRSSQRS